MARATGQEPQLAVVAGESGMGKTTLVRRLLGVVRTGTVRVLSASGEANEAALAYGVLGQLTGGKAEEGADPLAAGAGFLDFLGECEVARPVIVVVDDVQWADTPSLHALTFALRRLRVDRVLTVLVVRDLDDAALPDGLRRLCADDATLRITLDGLTPEQVQELGSALDRPLDRAAAQRLRDHTRGNPLHAGMLLRRLPAEQFDGVRPLPSTSGYELLAGRRLAACGAGARDLVRAGSVLGRVFAVHEAARIAGVDEPLVALEEALAAGLLEEGPEADAAFAHPLLHAAVYHGLGPVRRARLHTEAARVTTDRAAALRHRGAAAGAPDAALANEIEARARAVSARGDWSAAADLLRTAVPLTADPADRARRLWESAEHLLLAGDITRARAVADAAPAHPDTAIRRYVLGRLALAAGAQDEAGALLASAWQDRSPENAPHTRPRAAEQLAWLSLIRGDGASAVTWARRSPGAGTAGVRDVLALGLALSGRLAEGLAELGTGADGAAPPERGGSDAAGAAATPSTAALPPCEPPLDGLLARGVLLLWSDRPAEARRALAAADRRHRTEGIPGLGILALGFLAECAYRTGAWDEAVAHAHQAVSLAHDADQAWLLAFVHARAAAPGAGRGDPAAVEHAARAEAYAAKLGDPSDLAYAAIARAQLRHAEGDFAGIVQSLAPLDVFASPRDSIDEPGVFPWPALLAEALARTGRDADAVRLIGVHEARARARDRTGALASLARARGVVAAVRGDYASAQMAYREALAHLPLPFEAALIRLGYGATLRRAGRLTPAVTELEAAHGLFTQLGATPYCDRCAAELAACGRERPRNGQSTVVRLTAQELAVARLAATGLTNRQIGRELLLSVKTIEYHLSHVYAKLGVPSRTALATAMHASHRTSS